MTIQELDAIRKKKKPLIDVRRVVREQGESSPSRQATESRCSSAAERAAPPPTR